MTYTRRRPLWIVTGLLVATLSAACEQSRSHNPLSPLIAGPLAGVDITQPVPLEPEANRKFKPTQQPITLVIENPRSNSPRPYTIRIELASDAQFATSVASQDGLAPGANGRTSFQIPVVLPAGRVYYWRVRAEDGANTGNYSTPRAFEVLEPVVIGAPTPRSPIGGGRLTTRRPTLTVANAPVTGPHLTLRYLWEVATDQAFASRVAFEQTGAGASETSLTLPSDLALSTTFFWRVRVTDSEVTGNWSVTETFQTPLPVVGGGGSGPTVPPGNCASNNGDTLVQCIASKYPSYLAVTSSLHQRESNMAFLRDRVIEAGICGGLDLAWNLKRGVGPHSIDALAWRVNGRDEVVDIGAAFDDYSQPLRLQWGIVAGPPGYDRYSPRPTCG